MSTLSITKLYDLLSVKLGKETAESFVSFTEEKIKDMLTGNSKLLATKEDLANTKADMIKWMFVFWIGQVAVTVWPYTCFS